MKKSILNNNNNTDLLNVKIFASDEGFGHIVRQRAIIEELLKDNHNITLQTQEKLDIAKKFFQEKINYVNQFNNIKTKKIHGSLDVKTTHLTMNDHFSRFMQLTSKEIADTKKYDFIISDLVPEAIAAAKVNKIKSFGVCHFTWDWLYEKVFGNKKYVKLLEVATHEADAIFFPPFTPDEIISKYRDIAVKVPFIVYPFGENRIPISTEKLNILVLDSGTQALKNIIDENKESFTKLSQEYNFIIAPDINHVHNLIPKVDLVITRAGFNTISDCIAAKTPMLLIDEPQNPEIEHNLSRLQELHLGKAISVREYRHNFAETFEKFMREDYEQLKEDTKHHHFKTDGAEKIVKEIKRRYKNE